jgi:hypothetical protein
VQIYVDRSIAHGVNFFSHQPIILEGGTLIMQTTDERDENQEPETRNPHEPKEPTREEQRGMICKPSDRNPPRERFRGIMI